MLSRMDAAGVEEVRRNFPTVPVLIAHMGAVWDVPEACIVAGRNERIYWRRRRRAHRPPGGQSLIEGGI